MNNVTKHISNKWYQEATIKGVIMPQRRRHDTNEKRWKNLIEPLLPFRNGDDRLFTELGSNAGFYLRKMADFGFKTIGVEISDEFVAQARYWEENEPKGTIIVQADLNTYPLPPCQIVLLANIHYWLTPDELEALISKLKRTALYVIVVGRFRGLSPHKSPCQLEPLKESFSWWLQGEVTQDNKHYGTIFRSRNLVEKDTVELGFYQQLMKSDRFYPAFCDLIDKVLNGVLDGLNKNTSYYRYLQWRGDVNRATRFVDKVELIKSVAKEGIKRPLIIGRPISENKPDEIDENLLYDGDHRYILARELGIKKLICRQYGRKR